MGYFSTSSSGAFVFTNEQLGLMYVLATIIPAVMFVIMSLLLFIWYPLSIKKVEELQELKEKRLQELELEEAK